MRYGDYFIYEDDLANPYYLFEEALAKELKYSSDPVLQFMMEDYDMAIDIDISSSGNISVDIY
jgi:hypothetical protein